VAHDFNNLLAVIQGNAEHLMDELGGGHPAIRAIMSASNRGADLVRNLLAFSRQQPLRSEAVDPAGLVNQMTELLNRTLGPTIEIETSSPPDLWPVVVDPSQMEAALLNLTINARDSMPAGGNLKIECANISLDAAAAATSLRAAAGDYVVMAVSDTGTGMSKEVQARAFEPFFTTKEVGAGSGLGLSMLHGFANQSGGHVTLASDEGRGTTVRLFLPRSPQAPRSMEQRPDDHVPLGQGERVLVIEDDEELRDLVVRLLEGLEYQVTAASDPNAARAILGAGNRFDVVLCDVVLPGAVSGPRFAEEIRRRDNFIQIVFMSGFPAEASDRDSLEGEATAFLQKPFKRLRLAQAIREMLDRRPAAQREIRK
jgi:CheY-like chemotaxis protein